MIMQLKNDKPDFWRVSCGQRLVYKKYPRRAAPRRGQSSPLFKNLLHPQAGPTTHDLAARSTTEDAA